MKTLVKLSKDSRGNFQRDLGWKEEEGKAQHRFYFGTDPQAAQHRVLSVMECWDAVEARWKRAADIPHRTLRPVWDKLSLSIGKAVAAGQAELHFDPSEYFQRTVSEPHEEEGVEGLVQTITVPSVLVDADSLLRWINELQADFPMICLVQDGSWPQEARQQVEARAKTFKTMADSSSVLVNGVKATGQTLHQALDAFSVWHTEHYRDVAGRTSEHGNACIGQIDTIKNHVKNMPLDRFDLKTIDALIDYWAARPISKHGKAVAKDTAKNTIKRIRNFVKWLNRSTDFAWRKPLDYEIRPARIKLTPAEKAKRFSPTQVQTYSVDEIATIWKYASPRERVLIVLALNCGFGMRELGTLQLSEIGLDKPHGHYDVIGSFIKRGRYKTDVYGEWSLWPESVAAINWFLGQRPNCQETAFFVTRDGKTLVEPTEGNNRNGRIASVWDRLIKRIMVDVPGFKKLSFNKLRKTGGNLMRRLAGGELFAVYMAHGQSVRGDDLAEVYSDRPFDQVFQALDKVRSELAPVFDGVTCPFPIGDYKKRNPSVSIAVREKIISLRQSGKQYKDIATECEVSIDTVRRYLTEAGLVKAYAKSAKWESEKSEK